MLKPQDIQFLINALDTHQRANGLAVSIQCVSVLNELQVMLPPVPVPAQVGIDEGGEGAAIKAAKKKKGT